MSSLPTTPRRVGSGHAGAMAEDQDPHVIVMPPPYTGPPPQDSGASKTTTSFATSHGAGPTAPIPVIGVDIGGSGIKAAPVDPATGSLLSDRIRFDTPLPATPEAVASTVSELVARVADQSDSQTVGPMSPIGITLPSVIRSGRVLTAANIDAGWIGLDAVALFRRVLGRPVAVINDADAAGVAEMRFGAGRDVRGVVVVVTLGTGIGSAVFTDAVLVPNTELGHLPLRGGDAEDYAAGSVRKAEGLSMKKYAARLQEYLELVERLLWPELIVIGGGISKRSDEFLPLVDIRTPVAPARLRNGAGIVGAAALTADATRTTSS